MGKYISLKGTEGNLMLVNMDNIVCVNEMDVETGAEDHPGWQLNGLDGKCYYAAGSTLNDKSLNEYLDEEVRFLQQEMAAYEKI